MRQLLPILLIVGFAGRPAAGAELAFVPKGAPWGRIEVNDLYLLPRPNPDLIPIIAGNSGRWIFPVRNAAEMEVELAEAGIPPGWILRIRSLPFLRTGFGWETRPPEPFLLEIPMEIRGLLYQYLTRVDYDFSPFRIAPYIQDPKRTRRQIEKRFSPEVAELFETLLWKEGEACYFSDFHVLFSRLPNDSTRAELEVLLRERRSFVGKLAIVDSREEMRLAGEFWGAQGENPGGENLLKSLAAMAGPDRSALFFDVAHLLPPTARKLLHHFPPLEMPQGEDQPDCYWTAVNFFNEEVSDRVYDFTGESLFVLLESEYEAVEGAGRLGDVIVMSRIARNGSHETVHACNYLFEDYVYTKNGKSMQSPWMICRWSDLLPVYQRPGEELEVRWFRRAEKG